MMIIGGAKEFFYNISTIFLEFQDDSPRVMMMQRIRLPSLQRPVVQLVVHLMERFRHVHPFNTMLFHVAVKLVLLSHHIDNHIEGDLIHNYMSSTNI